MTKSIAPHALYSILLICSLLMGGCQSIEQLSIDYMLPAEMSFPASLKRVGVVNNMSYAPENKMITAEEQESRKGETEVARLTKYYNGNANIGTESLAQAIADANYFDRVVLCDSALRAHDKFARESTLTNEEVNALSQSLQVDLLIALENIQMRSTQKIEFSPIYGIYIGTIDLKVYPTVKVYLPERKGPMATITHSDSIFWEEAGGTFAHVRSQLIGEKELIEQASEFAGIAPVKHLLPYWQTADRQYFAGGSVNMRDAAVYVKRGEWETAVKLWEQTYQTKKGKLKMQAAYNLALGYEMQDSIETAYDWAIKAQTAAYDIDQVETKKTQQGVEAFNVPNYLMTTLYATELLKRKDGLARLSMQMQRFKDDF